MSSCNASIPGSSSTKRVSRSTDTTLPSGPTRSRSQREIEPPPAPTSRQRQPSPTPICSSMLEQIGVGEGWRCLDVGAGGGSISRWLRDRVGPDGRVVSVDLDTRFVEDEPGIEALQLDILSDDLEQEAFDLVHCRL